MTTLNVEAPSYMTEDLRIFENGVAKFLEREAVPNVERYIAQHGVDRALWDKAGEAGLLCASTPEEYGGPGGSFAHVRVPTSNLIGMDEGMGFVQLMQQLPQERLIIALQALAVIERALTVTTDYVKERRAFGKAIIEFQNTQFKLAECKTEATIGRVFCQHCTDLHLRGKLDATMASMAKLWLTDLQCRLVDECLQLHGGYGYMNEYPIARMYADSRVQNIYGGTNEIMKLLIARSL